MLEYHIIKYNHIGSASILRVTEKTPRAIELADHDFILYNELYNLKDGYVSINFKNPHPLCAKLRLMCWHFKPNTVHSKIDRHLIVKFKRI